MIHNIECDDARKKAVPPPMITELLVNPKAVLCILTAAIVNICLIYFILDLGDMFQSIGYNPVHDHIGGYYLSIFYLFLLECSTSFLALRIINMRWIAVSNLAIVALSGGVLLSSSIAPCRNLIPALWFLSHREHCRAPDCRSPANIIASKNDGLRELVGIFCATALFRFENAPSSLELRELIRKHSFSTNNIENIYIYSSLRVSVHHSLVYACID